MNIGFVQNILEGNEEREHFETIKSTKTFRTENEKHAYFVIRTYVQNIFLNFSKFKKKILILLEHMSITEPGPFCTNIEGGMRNL